MGLSCKALGTYSFTTSVRRIKLQWPENDHARRDVRELWSTVGRLPAVRALAQYAESGLRISTGGWLSKRATRGICHSTRGWAKGRCLGSPLPAVLQGERAANRTGKTSFGHAPGAHPMTNNRGAYGVAPDLPPLTRQDRLGYAQDWAQQPGGLRGTQRVGGAACLLR